MNRLTPFLFISLIIISFCPNAYAETLEDYEIEVLKNTPSVRVVIEDMATGGCWPDPKSTKAMVEEKLLKSGIPIKSDADLSLSIDVGGMRNLLKDGREIGCVVYMRMVAWHFGDALAPNGKPIELAMIKSFDREFLYGGARPTMQSGINQRMSAWTAEFVVLWLKSRQNNNVLR